jgi:NTP pyrophosphatase (non-canonical NTP hydrolase)
LPVPAKFSIVQVSAAKAAEATRTQPAIPQHPLSRRLFLVMIHPEIAKYTDNSPTLAQVQQRVDAWCHSIGVRYFNELTNLAQLMEEVGELSRIIARTYGEQSWKAGESAYNLPDEMADILFVLVCLANQTGVDLTAALEQNLDKKTRRDAQRHRQNPKLTADPST